MFRRDGECVTEICVRLGIDCDNVKSILSKQLSEDCANRRFSYSSFAANRYFCAYDQTNHPYYSVRSRIFVETSKHYGKISLLPLLWEVLILIINHIAQKISIKVID